MIEQNLNSVFASNLTELMASKGIKQIDVVNDLGVAKGTVSAWCSGINVPRSNVLNKLAGYLMVTPAYLLTNHAADNKSIPAGFIPLPVTEKKPILGRIACGEPILAEENIEGYADVPEGRGVDFCLICTGDSMIDVGIHEGDTVYIHQQPDVENGQIAAVRIGNTATLKRVYKQPGQLILLAENKSYMPMTYNEGSNEDIQIIGKAVGYQHWF